MVYAQCYRLLAALLVPLALVLTVYSTELFDYLALNTGDSAYVYGIYGVNTLLLNVLNRYHPLVFYFSVALLVTCLPLSLISTYGTAKHFINSNSHLSLTPFYWLAAIINLVAL